MAERDEAGWTARLAVVATSFRRVGMGRLGEFVLRAEATDEQEALRAALGADELVYLATCNRVECYLLLPPGSDGAELEARATAFFTARGATVEAGTFLVRTGPAAAERLFDVMSSLDSLVLGETEIAGQAKRAAERCAAAGLCGPTLLKLVERGTACSRRVRAETALGRAPASAATIAVSKIKKFYGAEGPGVTLLVGSGEMTIKVATALAGKPGERIFANRTKEKAEELAAKFGGRAVSLDELAASPPAWVDLVFAATAATEPVVTRAMLGPALAARRAAGAARPLIVCDLGLPRDVDPALDREEGVLVVDMQVIEALGAQAQAALAVEADKARVIVREEAERLASEDRFRVIAGESARAILDGRLAHLSEQDRETILRFAEGLASRIARQPRSAAS